jgi:hypothetical protein
MKPKHPLLDELLSDDPLDQLRAATLEQGLQVVRRRRRLRRVARTSAWIGMLAALAVAIPALFRSQPAYDHATQPTVPETVAIAQIELAPPAESQDEMGVHYLTDEQLLALFPGRPVALIGPPGDQRLVFLDEPIHPAQPDLVPLDL